MTRLLLIIVLIFHVFGFLLFNSANFYSIPFVVGGLAIISGLIVGKQLFKTFDSGRREFVFDNPPSYMVMIGLLALYSILKIDYIFETISSLLDGSYASIVLNRTIERYSGSAENLGISYQLGTIIFLFYCSIVGILLSSTHIQRKGFPLYHVCVLFLLIFFELSSSARASTFLGATNILFTSIYNSRDRLSSFGFGKIIIFLSIGIAISVIPFVFAGLFRLGDNDTENIILDKAVVYFLAFYQAGPLWLTNYDFELVPGFYTFSSIYKLFGVIYPQGFYDFVSTEFGDTNIYTFYRGLISDFSILYIPLLFIFSVIYVRIDGRKRSMLSFVIGMILFKMCMFIFISPYTFTTFLISDILYVLYVVGQPLEKSCKYRPLTPGLIVNSSQARATSENPS